MSPIVELLLILVSLDAAVLCVLIYFFLLEGLLKRLVGLIWAPVPDVERNRRAHGLTFEVHNRSGQFIVLIS